MLTARTHVLNSLHDLNLTVPSVEQYLEMVSLLCHGFPPDRHGSTAYLQKSKWGKFLKSLGVSSLPPSSGGDSGQSGEKAETDTGVTETDTTQASSTGEKKEGEGEEKGGDGK